MPAKQSTNWVFTINNPMDYKPENEWKDEFKYLVYQHEKGEKGTNHLQGYCQLKNRKTLHALKKLHQYAHWEIRKGSHEQARDYCMKQDSRIKGPFEFGKQPEQGKRTDLDAVKETIDSGASWKEIAADHFKSFVKYERGLRSYSALNSKSRDFKTQVIVCYGPTGTGKSMYCAEEAPDAYWYFPQKDGKWWDGYDGQEDIIIDEFYGQLQWSAALRLFDRYPCQVECKGFTRNFAPKRIFITSNKEPIEWYSSKYDQFETLNRRLDVVLSFPSLGTVIPMKGEQPTTNILPKPMVLNTDPDTGEIIISDAPLERTPSTDFLSEPITLLGSRFDYDSLEFAIDSTPEMVESSPPRKRFRRSDAFLIPIEDADDYVNVHINGSNQ